MRSGKIRFSIVNAAVPIFIAGVLYYFFCPDTIFVNTIDYILQVGAHFQPVREIGAVFVFFRNYGLDALWAYSLVFVLFLVFEQDMSKLMHCLLISFLFGVVMELLQLFQLFSGTFDILDMVAEGVAGGIAVLIIKKSKTKESPHEEN